MALFSRKGDLIDYTYLQKRGLIKKSPEVEKSNIVRTKDGFIDLANSNNVKEEDIKNPFSGVGIEGEKTTDTKQIIQTNQAQNTGFTNFFDAPLENTNTYPNTQTNQEFKEENINKLTHTDISSVKIKIENLEYKLEQLIDKISNVESKLGNFEKKMGMG